MKGTLKNGLIYELREVEVSDAQVVLDYMRIINKETQNLTREPEEFNMTLEQEEQFLLKTVESKDNHMIALFIENELASCAGFHGSPLRRLNHKVSLGISVLKKYHNLGIGYIVMNELIAKAKEYGKLKMELEVRSDNPNAIHLYKKCGFTVEGERQMGFYVNSKYVSLTEMGLDLRKK